LTEKQARFVIEYLSCLNATEAARRAGYSQRTAYSIGQENLKKPEIQTAIQQAMTERNTRLIADREQRQAFWTATMFDEDKDMKHRLKASELLGKSEGDFIERNEVNANVTTCAYDLGKLSEEELIALRGILAKAEKIL